MIEHDERSANPETADETCLAWERRDELGIFTAFTRSFYGLLIHPAKSLREPPADGGVFGAGLYAFLTTVLGGTALALALCIAYLPTKPNNLFREFFFIFAATYIGLLLHLAYIVILTGVSYGLLRILRVGSVRLGGLIRTICYTYGTMACVVIVGASIAFCISKGEGLELLGPLVVVSSVWYACISLSGIVAEGGRKLHRLWIVRFIMGLFFHWIYAVSFALGEVGLHWLAYEWIRRTASSLM